VMIVFICGWCKSIWIKPLTCFIMGRGIPVVIVW